ncbi:tetratricopeptide repeat protein [Qipengyuania sp. XHP0207]|uniref:tetratricopeptide repeat protein n=1 Tax=Qipengyuania sp. XHP0207 TaxID=3038078 RepID=UPI00241E6C2F|nr:tetratricopeptide repeat protein [Qipengyuania sp. XHP0207]MDG5747408.1 tetratricopeptide repeat protein [Qipengyuania sp. XHP0207]
MRFAPAAAALSLVLAATASVGWSADRDPNPRAAMLITEGQSALENGNVQGAIDAYEAALAVDPGYTPLYLRLAEAARADQLQGKAIRYYREVLARDPRNFAAISGEGQALLEKGAIEKARGNLVRLETACGKSCPETERLAAAIETGAQPRVQTAEATITIEPQPQSN